LELAGLGNLCRDLQSGFGLDFAIGAGRCLGERQASTAGDRPL